MLKPNDKGYYKPKLLDRRKKYDSLRNKFFRIEEEVDRIFKDFDQQRRARYRLTDGVAEIHRQGHQLEEINRIGMETHTIMRSAN